VFGKVLIANRGEIALRVQRTCRRLGIATVAVFSDADADAPHVTRADEAVRLGPAPAADSYLVIERVVQAALDTGADAIHPGYGFLSENAGFARAVRDAGVAFVGPDAETIALMGDKGAAKRHLQAVGVPVVPGVHAKRMDDEALAGAADAIGYPLLVKAVAGGGGKGMRAVHDAAGLDDAVRAARREAQGAFGDDRLLIERLVSQPRHVEVQILADQHSNVLHVFERECSVQRRHQKVLEEAPSPALDPELRAEMGAVAVRAAKSVAYLGAGTVELLLSGTDRRFYFLEMNTRLQVEHPVTELVARVGDGGTIDLVEQQLRVAAGEPLAFTQDELHQSGHAIEARLYAEDPANEFLPQTGTLEQFHVPTGDGIRVDTGVEDGSEVTRFYDPMLAKLVVHAATRSAAVERLTWLLEHTTVLGLTTNVEFLAAAVGHPAFRQGELTTSFIDDHLADWAPDPTTEAHLVAAAVALLRDREAAAGSAPSEPNSPWQRMGPWRIGGVGGWKLRLRAPEVDEVVHVTVSGSAGAYVVALGDRRIDVATSGDGSHLRIGDHEAPARTAITAGGASVWVWTGGRNRRIEVLPATHHSHTGLAGDQAFTAPMPGAVVAVEIEAGASVVAGATLVVVEAMKMEHAIKAPVDGTVTAVHVGVGDAVDAETILLEFEPHANEPEDDDEDPA